MDPVALTSRPDSGDWGRGSVLLFLFLLLLGTGLLRQWRAVERDPMTGAPAILEAQSVWNLRRTSLAIETTRLPQADSFLSFPGSAASTSLPVYPEFLAVCLRALSAGRVGGPRTVVDERWLMGGALWIGPLLGSLFLVALFLWNRKVLGAPPSAACLAALWCALLPVCLEAGQPGRLYVELFAALGMLAGTALVREMLRASSALDRYTYAMFAGGVFGFGLATSPLFLLPLGGVWAAFLFEALRAQGEARADWGRSLLLFWITAALGASLPSMGGPWLPATDGIVRGWTSLCSWLMVLGAAPFLGMLWFPRWDLRARAQALLPSVLFVILLSAGGLLWTLGPDHERLALLFGSMGWGQAGPAAWQPSPGGLALLLLGGVAFWQARRILGREWSAWGVLICVWGLGAFVAGILHEPAALCFLPLGAAAVGLAFEETGTRWIAGLSLAAPLGLAGWSTVAVIGSPDLEGLKAMEASRWLRLNTRSPGAANSVHPVQDWGVLADARSAPLVAWYGRRPCASLGPFRNGDVEGRRSLREVLQQGSVADFEDHARALGVEWVLFGPGSFQRLDREGARPELLRSLSGLAAAAGEPATAGPPQDRALGLLPLGAP